MNQETRNFETERKILDSGERRQFDSGAVRDIAEGKGRCDLLPLDIVAEYNLLMEGDDNTDNVIYNDIINHINIAIREGELNYIYYAIHSFAGLNKWGPDDLFIEVSKHYEEGAKKYEERNWEKGIPAHCYVDSGIRHLLKWANHWDDEPHARAFVWNMLGLLWTIKHKPELNDLPYNTSKGE